MTSQTPGPQHSASTFGLIAYFAHLLFPLYLFVETLRAQHFGPVGKSGTLILAISALWLFCGIAVLIFSRDRSRFLRRMSAPLLAISVCYVSLFVLEVAARVATHAWAANLYEPGTRRVLHPDPVIVPGVQGTSRFSVNEIGLRGPSLPKREDVYKIVAVGGSTTECLYLDDAKTWPALLMEKLNSRQSNVQTWVANAGVSGYTTVDHLSFLRNLPTLRQAQMLIFMVGANDLTWTLAFAGASTQSHLEKQAAAIMDNLKVGTDAGYTAASYKRLRLFYVMHKASRRVAQMMHPAGIDEGPTGQQYVALRARRARGPIVPLPDLSIGLKEYHDRIVQLGRECEALRTRCIFLTQPSMVRSDLPEAEQKLLWVGYIGRIEHPTGFVGVADFAKAIDAYNSTLMGTCKDQRLECYDVAPLVPRDTSSFYDDYHFNEGGSALVADYLSKYLLSTPPFKANKRSIASVVQEQ